MQPAAEEVQVHYGRSHLFSYRWDKSKPYIHPLNTLSGNTLSLLCPYDHVWHLGLFFSWKYVNGVNVWEEEADCGCARQTGMEVTAREDGVTLRSRNEWVTAAEEVLLDERRSVHAGVADGFYSLDFDMIFSSPQPRILLDRTDPEILKYGGYSGLAFRPVRSMYDNAVVENSNGQLGMETDGAGAKWIRYAGKLDGVNPDTTGGIALLDHPENPRYPSPFYSRDSTRPFGFICTSFIFHEPYEIKNGESLRLRYRVVVHDGEMESAAIRSCHDRYATGG